MRKCFLWICITATAQAFGSPSEPSQEKALKRLIEGNQRYVEEKPLNPDQGRERRVSTTLAQSPFAVILGCSDSRVAPEIIFDQGIGDLFIVRVAGNVAGPIELDSIEYAALYLESTLIVVLGHENCGAVKAVFEGKTQDIEAVASLITPAIETAKKTGMLELAIKDNIRHVTNQLKKTPVIAGLIAKKKISVVPAYYDFLSGKVEFLDNY